MLDDLAGAGPGVLVAAVFLLVGGPKRLPGLVTVVAVINRSCRQSHLLVNDPARDVHRVMDHMGLGSDVVIVLLHGVLWSPNHKVMNVAPQSVAAAAATLPSLLSVLSAHDSTQLMLPDGCAALTVSIEEQVPAPASSCPRAMRAPALVC